MSGDGGDADERRRFERIMIVTLVAIVALGGAAYALLPNDRPTSRAGFQEQRFAARGVIVEGGVETLEAPPVVAVPQVPMPPLQVAPGAPQPVDETQAREAISSAFNTVFGAQFNREARLANIDDPAGLDHQFDQVAASYPEAAETAKVAIEEIVFTSADRATVTYEVAYSGGAAFGRRIGEARRSDSGWKVTRQTVCELFAFAGAPCAASEP